MPNKHRTTRISHGFIRTLRKVAAADGRPAMRLVYYLIHNRRREALGLPPVSWPEGELSNPLPREAQAFFDEARSRLRQNGNVPVRQALLVRNENTLERVARILDRLYDIQVCFYDPGPSLYRGNPHTGKDLSELRSAHGERKVPVAPGPRPYYYGQEDVPVPSQTPARQE